jgi:N utilization substance protein B
MSRAARHNARERALQALYQWQLTGDNVSDIDAQFLDDQDMKEVDVPYFQELLHQVPARLHELDAVIGPFLDRPIDQVDPVERAILRLACYELMVRQEIPYRVVINEGVELAKVFGAEQGHRYINGILDKAAQQVRAVEVQAPKKKRR